MNHPIRKICRISALSYILVIVSAVAVSVIAWLATGYFPSFTFFVLALISFRLVEVHTIFLAAPLIVSIISMTILSITPINKRIAAGLGIASYYLLVTMLFLISGAGDFPLDVSIPWIIWVFIVGFVSSALVDKFRV